MKTGRLTNEEKTYISQNQSMGVKELAARLDRKVDSVQKHLNTLPTLTEPVRDNQWDKSVATIKDKTTDKPRGKIMTQGGSQVGDLVRKQFLKEKQDCIHKPKG